jgi:quercetin dioxygenase-like cupin family protein
MNGEGDPGSAAVGAAAGPASLDALADAMTEPWQPVEVARVNESAVRLARADGEFPWHHHDEDELFLCWRGTLRIQMQGRDAVTLHPGELVVVPKGAEHRPVADEPAYALMLERVETKQYGN